MIETFLSNLFLNSNQEGLIEGIQLLKDSTNVLAIYLFFSLK
jgi:hypothetical protein